MTDVNANMARFMEAKERARKLIQMDANGQLDKYGKDKINEFRGNYGEDGQTSPEIVMENTHNVQRDYSKMPMPSNSKLSNSKLPTEILESFKKKQINTDLLGVDTGQASVLDLFENTKQNAQPQQTTKKQIIKENITSTQQVVSSNNVDYSLIKTIVEDTMKRYTSALKKSLINENKSLMTEDNNLQAMKIGNKFTFITKNGDLYEAKLTKIGNINEKKSRG